SYYGQLAKELSDAFDQVASQRENGLQNELRNSIVHRLHSGKYWTFEEDAERGLAILLRTPRAVSSLADLIAENEAVLTCLKGVPSGYGLGVDTRQAPLRNDADFEDAMARLRSGLTGHFRRTAVLLESNLGELQVTRLERDERRYALATRSESTA